MGRGTFFKVGGPSARQKTIENFCGLNWQQWRHKHWNMTSLTTPYEGQNYTILDKSTPLW